MDAISVGAISGGNYTNVVYPDVLALSDEYVNPFAIKGSDALQDSIGDLVELNVLLQMIRTANGHKQTILNFNSVYLK